MVAQGLVSPGDMDIVSLVDTAEEAVDWSWPARPAHKAAAARAKGQRHDSLKAARASGTMD